MLKLFAPSVVSASYNIGLIAERFVVQSKDAMARGQDALIIPLEAIRTISLGVVSLERIGDDLRLTATKRQAERCLQLIKDSMRPHDALHCHIHAMDVQTLAYKLDALSTTFSDEMSEMVFVATRKGDAELLNDGAVPFGADVADAFPSSVYDIEEAARCRAMYRWTACVMHLMRALEPALHALQSAVKVDVQKEQWDQIINQIDAKIREITRRSHGKADEQWYSEAASHFRLIKNAWRNHAQHLHERYDEERAMAIYDSVRHFLRHLATKLKEGAAG
jgi:hypothetical protein